MDTLYYEQRGDFYEAWTYCDGCKRYLLIRRLDEIERYAKRYRYRLIFVH